MPEKPTDTWYWAGCLECVFEQHSIERSLTCPNDGSPMLSMPALRVADDVVKFARLSKRLDVARSEFQYAETAMTTFRETERSR